MKQMKTVTARKVESNVITIAPPTVRIRFVGQGRKRYSDKGNPCRAARKRLAFKD